MWTKYILHHNSSEIYNQTYWIWLFVEGWIHIVAHRLVSYSLWSKPVVQWRTKHDLNEWFSLGHETAGSLDSCASSNAHTSVVPTIPSFHCCLFWFFETSSPVLFSHCLMFCMLYHVSLYSSKKPWTPGLNEWMNEWTPGLYLMALK